MCIYLLLNPNFLNDQQIENNELNSKLAFNNNNKPFLLLLTIQCLCSINTLCSCLPASWCWLYFTQLETNFKFKLWIHSSNTVRQITECSSWISLNSLWMEILHEKYFKSNQLDLESKTFGKRRKAKFGRIDSCLFLYLKGNTKVDEQFDTEWMIVLKDDSAFFFGLFMNRF